MVQIKYDRKVTLQGLAAMQALEFSLLPDLRRRFCPGGTHRTKAVARTRKLAFRNATV